jgi:signal transduction histidine kinase
VHLTEDLMSALGKEQEISNFKSNLYSVASHEFKTPLAVIQANLEMLKVKNSEKLLKSSLYSMEEEIDKLNNLIADMLQLKKLASNETPFYPDKLDLHQLLVELIASDIQKRFPKISVNLKNNAEGATEITADYSLLRYVFGNLLSNACKYSGSSAEVTVSLKVEGQQMLIEVSDKGIGIPKEEQASIFTSFYRASNVGHIGGTGVGLSIVKEFVKKHGGEINFESNLGKGTSFIVTIPIK